MKSLSGRFRTANDFFGENPISPDRKYKRLQGVISKAGKVAVAFSGGVDSTLLLKAAFDVLGDEAAAFHACSPLQGSGEQARAEAVAESIGCRFVKHAVDPLGWPDFVANPPDRCYLCKKRIYRRFFAAAQEAGIPWVLDGTNLDDLGGDRPGLRALREQGVRTPLVEVGLRKEEIRRLSRKLGLSTWNQPSASCLATRIATGLLITRENLAMVDRCEGRLRSLGFSGSRVRFRSDSLVIEVLERDLTRIVSPEIRSALFDFCEKTGRPQIFLHLRGR